MSILKNRIKNLEKDTGSIEKFCQCFTKRVNNLVDANYDGQSGKDIDFSTLPERWCPECKLPVNTELIESLDKQITFVYGI